MMSCSSPAAICVWGSDYGTTRAQFMSWTRRRPGAVSDHGSSFLFRNWGNPLAKLPDLDLSHPLALAEAPCSSRARPGQRAGCCST
jgi:hypothetical protein